MGCTLMKRIKQTGLHQVGGSLSFAENAGCCLPVPDFMFAFDFFAERQLDLERDAAYLSWSGELVPALSQQLQDWAREQFGREDLDSRKLDSQEFSQKDCRFAVRSSATIEDGKASSLLISLRASSM